MELMRVNGKNGVQLYDKAIWTEDEALEDYLDQTGVEPIGTIHYKSFDALSGSELTEFIRSGNA